MSSLTEEAGPPPAGPAESGSAEPRVPSKRLRVLLVEDLPDLGPMLVKILELLGHDATLVTNVKAAVAAGKCDGFDLLISDYSLPDGTGVDVIRRLPPIKALLITAYGAYVVGDLVRAAGFSASLNKPFTPEALRIAIETAVK